MSQTLRSWLCGRAADQAAALRSGWSLPEIASILIIWGVDLKSAERLGGAIPPVADLVVAPQSLMQQGLDWAAGQFATLRNHFEDRTSSSIDAESGPPSHVLRLVLALVLVMAKLGIAALLGLLGLAAYFMVVSMNRFADAEVPTSGTVAMWLGIIFSLVVGCGLMALVFYSSRRGYDR